MVYFSIFEHSLAFYGQRNGVHMQNKAEVIAGKKLPQILSENTKWLKSLGFLGIGAIMASASLFGLISPFGVAFCAALGGTSSIAAALGAVIGYTFTSAAAVNMKYIAAVMLVAAAKAMFGGRTGLFGKSMPVKRGTAVSVIITLLAMLVSSAAVILSAGFTFYDLLLCFSEITIACGATYFFARGEDARAAGLSGASKSDLSCIIISLAIIATGFSGFQISGLSLGRMLCVLAILLAAAYGGEAAGSVAGIVAGIAMAISGGDLNYVIAAYAFGGLIAGVLGGMGRIAAAVAFISVNAVTAFLTQDASAMYISLLEVFAASVIFVAMPSSLMAGLRPLRRGASGGNGMRGLLRDRLSDISDALSSIGATTRKVGEELGKLEGQDANEVAVRAVDRVCRRCSMKNTCWQFSYNDTRDALSAAVLVLKRDGGINRASLPRYLAANCTKTNDMLTELNAQFQAYLSREGVSRKVSQVRSVLTNQFDSLSMIMDEFSEQLYALKSFDEAKARRVREYFEKSGIEARRVTVFTDEHGRVTAMLTIPNYHIAKMNRTKAALDLCGLLEAELDLPHITARKQQATVVFTEKASYAIEFGAYQIAASGGKLCGDAYEFIKNQNGKSHFILSDGMGCGGSAAVDSSMTSSIVAQLLSAGVSHDAALKLVNSALMIKSGDESLATLDIASVDLYSGKADFYKAGAAPTYLIRNGKAGYVESSSLPVGILRGVTFGHSAASLRENDVLVMISDGVTATGSDWVKTELEYLKSGDMQRMCERLAATAKNRRKDNHEDDITVLAAALRRVE